MSGDARPKGAESANEGTGLEKEEDWAGLGAPTHRRGFDDGSDITYYDSGRILVGRKPTPITEEPYPVPKAELFFWNGICRRTDITTREQIREARKQMRGERGRDV